MTRTTRLFVTFLSIATLMFGASLAHATTDITLTAGSTAVSTSSLSLSSLGVLNVNSTNSATGNETITITDNRGSGAGWNVSVAATNFVATVVDPTEVAALLTVTLPISSVLSAMAAAPAVAEGQTDMTGIANTASTPVTTDSISLLSADDGYGMGSYTSDISHSFSLPKTVDASNIISTGTTTSKFQADHSLTAGIFAGTYTTTITYSISNAP